MTEQGYRLLEHTADMGVEATAPTAGTLFVEAARGLLEILGGDRRGKEAEEERVVSAEGIDREDLLVRWLDEILYVVESGRFYPASFEVEEAEYRQFRARIKGASYDPDLEPLDREVKAITYHGLSIERDKDGGWRAQFFVDL